MRRWNGLLLAALTFLGVRALGTTLSVLQPNSTSYSPPELAALHAGLPALESILSDPVRGSNRYFAPSQWGSRAFASYTAGVLAASGYVTHVVAQAGWPDGTHSWVLVGMPLGTQTAWIPVEATPLPTRPQEILGSIPSHTDPSGQVWFDDRYVHFDAEVELPANAPPLAVVRFSPPTPKAGDTVTLWGTECADPDGEIIRYVWTLSDGTRFEARNVEHTFTSSGTYSITVMVTDSRGATAAAASAIVVSGTGGGAAPPPSCNCRGGP